VRRDGEEDVDAMQKGSASSGRSSGRSIACGIGEKRWLEKLRSAVTFR
jgi:hypothetical protein